MKNRDKTALWAGKQGASREEAGVKRANAGRENRSYAGHRNQLSRLKGAGDGD